MDVAVRLGWTAFSVAWRVLGWGIFSLLAILEPLVCYSLSALASLGLATTLLFGVLLKAPHFSVLFMGSMSIGFFLLLAPYYWILGCFGAGVDGRRDR
jgi:hypothetical protein